MEVFLKVADYHSLTKVADELGMTQPAVSAIIKRIEEFAGTPLFIRRGRRFMLNQAGDSFYCTAAAICVNVNHIKESFAVGYSNSRELIITMKIHSDWLLRKLDEFTAEHSDIGVTIRPSDDENRRSRQPWISDFSVMFKYDIQGMENIPIDAQDTLYVILPSGHHFAGREYIYLDELQEENFVFSWGGSHTGYDSSYSACLNAGFLPKISLVTDSAKGKYACIQNGCGIGLVYNNEMAVPSRLYDCSLVPIRNVLDRRTICIAWQSGKLSETGRVFLDFMQK